MIFGIALSCLFFFASFLIWKKQKLWLIAGYHEESFKGDKKALARDAGAFSFIIGVLTLGLALLIEPLGDVVGIIYTIVVIVLSLGFIIKVNWDKRK